MTLFKLITLSGAKLLNHNAIVDLSGNFVLVNEVCAKKNGYKNPDEMKGINIMSLVLPEYKDISAELFGDLLRGVPIENFELDVVNKDGKKMRMRMSARLINSHDGSPLYIVALLYDITDIVRLEKDTSEKMKELQSMNKLMTGRELKMIELKNENLELKKEVNDLLKSLGKTEKY